MICNCWLSYASGKIAESFFIENFCIPGDPKTWELEDDLEPFNRCFRNKKCLPIKKLCEKIVWCFFLILLTPLSFNWDPVYV